METDGGWVEDHRPVLLSDDSGCEEDCQDLLPRRGRPRLSPASAVLIGSAIRNPFIALDFPRLEQYKNTVAALHTHSMPTRSGGSSGKTWYKLIEGQEEMDRLLHDVGVTEEKTRLVARRMQDERRDGLNKTGHLFHPQYVDLLLPDKTKGPPARIERPAVLLKDQRVKAIELVYAQGLSYSDAARAMGVTAAWVWRQCHSYKLSPQKFTSKIKAGYDEAVVFQSETREGIKTSLTQEGCCLVNSQQLESFLRRFVDKSRKTGKKKLLRAARVELKLTRRKPKVSRGIPRLTFTDCMLRDVNRVLLHLFFEERSMLIFDGSTFLNDKLGTTAYGFPGFRPTLVGASSPRPIHLLALIGCERPEAIQLVKGSVRTQTIDEYFLLSLSQLADALGRNHGYRYLFLDNAPVHSELVSKNLFSRFSIRVIYNLSRNPANNPIEHLFAVYKRKYRAVALNKRTTDPCDILTAIRSVAPETYRATLRMVLHRILEGI